MKLNYYSRANETPIHKYEGCGPFNLNGDDNKRYEHTTVLLTIY